MKVVAGRDVPKDRRTNADISANSAPAASPAGADDRRARTGPARLRFDRYALDLRRGCLLDGGREVALRPKTFELLRYLACNPGRLASKDELLAAI
jgi:DNA-binding response OmpR family regulator